ncbi:hypothetical protein [Nodosilinea sp. E11]|uniref:hypothetical protein n=1 Tax=Nodosilinea sp. E11 TaxID=3037479 RepID=UPI002934B5FD|nr:hypothetical protein [Nodosilinea sp. E11]WOD40906.1 hypothetical protein RRF56_08885 [Nodosilinea sp. E11]
MRRPHRQSGLMPLTFKLVKYFLLTLAGFTITYIAAIVLDLPLVAEIIVVVLERGLGRSLVLLGCLWAIAVINESARS